MFSTRRLLAAFSTAYFLIGFRIATSVAGPLLSADDVAYLAMGRTLAGGGEAPLPTQPPYGVLYPSLMAPGWALGLGEDAMLSYARVVNALAGAVLVPVLYAIVKRMWRPDRGVALAAALIGAGLPALWLTATMAWTERLLALLVAVAVLSLLRLAERPTYGRLSAAVVAGVAMFGTHPRMGIATVTVTGLAAWLVVRQNARLAATALGGGAALLAVTELARRGLASATFGSTGTYDAGDLASRRGLGELPEMVQHGVGTLAYLVLAGSGVAVLGIVWWWRWRPAGVIVPMLLASVVFVAGWFLTGVDRSDAWLHGRYVEVISPLLVTAGVVALGRIGWRTAAPILVVTPIVAGIVAAWAGPGNNWSTPRSPVMMLGVEVSGAPFGNDIFEPGAAAAVALVAGLAMWGAWRVGGATLMTILAMAGISVGVLSGIEVLDQLHDGSIAGQVSVALAEGDPIGELMVETAGVSPNLIAALAWEAGLDATYAQVSDNTSHLLLPTGAVAPAAAELVAEFSGGTLWSLTGR